MNKNIHLSRWYYFLIPLFFVSFFIFVTNQSKYFSYADFGWWKNDAEIFSICLFDNFNACGFLSKYPLAYLTNSYIISWLSSYSPYPENSLKIIQVLFLILPVFIFFLTYKIKYGLLLSFLYLILISATPLIHFYIPSGALEIQSGVVLGCLITLSSYYLSVTSNRLKIHYVLSPYARASTRFVEAIPYFTNFLIFFFCLYKDTNLVLILSVLVATLFLKHLFNIKYSLTLTSAFRLWGIGSILGLLLQVIYNIVRYKSPLPLAYLFEADLLTPNLNQALTSLIGLLFSPNGGFLVFWGLSFSILSIILIIYRIRVSISNLIFTFILIFIGLIGQSMWWNPFGWDSWGARLSIPYGLALIIGCLGGLSPMKAKNDTIINQFKAIIFISIVIILSCFSLRYISIGYLNDPKNIFEKALFSQPSCATMKLMNENRPKNLSGDNFWRSDYYWNCAIARYWTDPSQLVNK